MATTREVSIQIVKQNADGTMLVRTSDANPFGGGGGGGSGSDGMAPYVVNVQGRDIKFASREDYDAAMEVYGGQARQMQMQNRRSSGGGMARKFLAGGADAAQAVSSLFAARNLQQQRNNLQDSLDNAAAARDKIAAKQTAYPDLIPALLEMFDAERDAMAAAIQILDDQITNLDVEAGTNAVRLVSEFMWDQEGGWSGSSNDSSLFQGLAFTGVGLGLGYLLSNTVGGRNKRGGGGRNRR